MHAPVRSRNADSTNLSIALNLVPGDLASHLTAVKKYVNQPSLLQRKQQKPHFDLSLSGLILKEIISQHGNLIDDEMIAKCRCVLVIGETSLIQSHND